MKHLIRHTIISIMLLSMLTGCSVLRDRVEEKRHKTTQNDKIIKENEQRIAIRPKEQVIYVPQYKYKDTTIIVNGRNTTLKVNYDKTGKIDRADCISEAFYEFINTQREINQKVLEQINDTKSDVKTETKPVSLWILYVFLGLAGLLIINKISLWQGK